MEVIKKTTVELLEMKTTMSQMKNILDGADNKLDITEEQFSEKIEGTEIETMQN